MPPPGAEAEGDDNDRTLRLALGKIGLWKRPTAKFDDFYTPQNDYFYAGHSYLPLNPSRREFRLLKVHPHKRTAERHLAENPSWARMSGNTPADQAAAPMLACEVVEKVPLSKMYGQYTALSYSAGKHSDTVDILVNGCVFRAFANLAHAIDCALNRWTVQSPGSQLLLWVDQICINQSNPDERGSQVAMMGDIYRHCKQVFVCLSTVQSTSALDAFTWMEPDQLEVFSWAATSDPPTSPEELGRGVARLFGEPGALASWQQSLEAFLKCPWWSRSWVYQEFILAPVVQFLYGYKSKSPQELSSGRQFLSDIASQLPEIKYHILAAKSDLMEQLHIVEKRRHVYEQVKLQAQITEAQGAMEATEIMKSDALDDLSAIQREIYLRNPDNPSLQGEKDREWEIGRKLRQLEAKLIEQKRACRLLLQQWSKVHVPPAKVIHADEHDRMLSKLHQFFDRCDVKASIKHTDSLHSGRSSVFEPGELKALLRHSRNCHASDPRDKVYAFIGCAFPSYKIIPDYSSANTAVHLFIATAQKIIEHDRNLDIIEHATRGRQDIGCYLPGWVPDWTCKEDNSVTEAFRAILQSHMGGHDKLFTSDESCLESTGEPAVVPGYCYEKDDLTSVKLKVQAVLLGNLPAPTNLYGKMSETSLLHAFSLPVSGFDLTAWCPKRARAGDGVWIINGMRTPVVLRPETDNNSSLLGLVLLLREDDGRPSDLMSRGAFGQLVQGGQEEPGAKPEDILIL